MPRQTTERPRAVAVAPVYCAEDESNNNGVVCVKIAMCQIVSGTDKTANLAQIDAAVRRAAEQGADLAVLPEFAMYYAARLSDEFVAAAEPIDPSLDDARFVTELARITQDTGIAVVAGTHAPVANSPKAVNTLIAVDASGNIMTTYAKQHLYDAFGSKESDYVEAGASGEATQITVAGVTIGLLTCYDVRFPEPARVHADAGTDVLLYPAAWMPGPRKEDHWKTLARARAIENTLYVVAVSQAPKAGVGGSLAVDPHGIILAELGERPDVTTITIDAGRIAEVRQMNPSLANRRYLVQPR